MIRDLDDKVLCSSSEVELPWSTTMQAFRQRFPCQGDRSPATHWLLALKTALTRIPPCCLFLVASFLSLCFARLARLGTFCSVCCQLSSFLLEKLGGLDCWPSHWWCSVNCRRSRHQLVKVVFVERADKFSKVLDRWGWLPGVLFLWVFFSKHQIVEAW